MSQPKRAFDVVNAAYQPILSEVWNGVHDEDTLRSILPSRVRALHPCRRAVYTVCAAKGEIDNGGFHQYFFNSTGYFAPEAAEDMDRIGAPAYASLMREAIATLFGEVEMQTRIREQPNLESFFASYKDTALTALDDRFYKMDRTDPLDAKLAAHIEANAEHFEM